MTQIYESMDAATPKKTNQNELEAEVQSSLEKIGRKFIVMSGKGGVGKSSTAVNLAIALSRRGNRVGILDVDLHGPDIPRMLGLSERPDVGSDQRLIPLRYSDNLKAVSMESFLPNADDAVIWRGPLKYSAIQQFLGRVDWGDLDFLIIDAPPGTGDEPLTVAQTIRDAKAIIVTTPQEVSLADVRKSISFCRKLDLEIFGIIENMSGFTCPHCGEAIDLFGQGGGEKTAAAAGIRFLGKIPFDRDVVVCGDSGACYQDRHTDSPVTRAFENVAEQMTAEIN